MGGRWGGTSRSQVGPEGRRGGYRSAGEKKQGGHPVLEGEEGLDEMDVMDQKTPDVASDPRAISGPSTLGV